MTAYYTFRLYFRVFQGPEVIPAAPASAHGHGHEPDEGAAASHSAVATGTAPSSGVDVGQTHHDPAHGAHDHGHHNHEPWIMMLPLVVLAIGAFTAGLINFPKFDSLGHFLGHSPSLIATYDAAKHIAGYKDLSAEALGQEAVGGKEAGPNYALMALSGLISIAGIGLAYLLHLRDRAKADALAASLRPLVRLLDAKFWVDEVYQGFIVEPLRTLGKILNNVFDRFIVDGLVNLAGMIPQAGGIFLRLTMQRGYLQGYAAAMLFGIAVILLVIFMHS
jgi:NADH-quinone oxidoreductase subunit L